MINWYADISTREACTVTRKLDLDQIWKKYTRTLKTEKDTDVVKLILLLLPI